MPTVVLDPAPHELQALIERRRRIGVDSRDEVWDGTLHMVPGPSHAHAALTVQVFSLLLPPATAAGLTVTAEFNVGYSKDDFRVPDGGLHRPDAAEMWHPTAALVLEIVSPGDETWQKLPFYAAHRVDELLILDPAARTVHWLALAGGGYAPLAHSALIDLSAAAFADMIDWP